MNGAQQGGTGSAHGGRSVVGTAMRRGALVAWLVVLIAVGCGVVGMLPSAAAQAFLPLGDVSVRGVDPGSTLDAAIRLVSRDRPAEALPLLQEVVAASPATVSPEHGLAGGTAAYWLGTAYARTGRPDAARRAWSEGHVAVRRAGRFDARLLDAYLHSLTPTALRGERLRAVRAYTDLLGGVGAARSDADQALYRRHVAQLAPLLTDTVFARVLRSPSPDRARTASPMSWTFRPGAGAVLQTWWRRQDPFPATPENERLEEHLTRLVIAEARYACPARPTGLDDRGVAYLQYGTPRRTHSIRFANGEFFREVFRFGVNVTTADFPENELWLYTHVDDAGYYLFVRDAGTCFTTGTTADLLPARLTQSRSATERGLNIAYSALMALRYVYADLALFHADFGPRYADVASYAEWQESQAISRRLDDAMEAAGMPSPASSVQSTTVGAGLNQERTVSSDPVFGIDPPTLFVSRIMARGRAEDAAAARRRRAAMPRSHTELLSAVEPLPVAVRTARFLREDGTTASRVTWGLRAGDLRPDADDDPVRDAVVSFAAVRYDTTYRAQQTIRHQHVIGRAHIDAGAVVVGPVVTTGGTTAPYHLGLQWTQSDADAGPSGVRMRALRRLSTARVPSVEPLHATAERLEMSDVQLFTRPATGSAEAPDPEAVVPYPFPSVSASASLLLGFEIYHLAFAPDDWTHYTVAYEVEQHTPRGWTRLFRRDDTRRTAAEATYSGCSRRTDELIELDLASLARENTQSVRVTVRVTDTVTGESVERDVAFTLE